MNLLEAMAKFEGFGLPNARSTRNNNPSNIEWGKFAKEHGATRIEEIPEGYRSRPRYAYFPDVKLGWRAMKVRLTTGMYEGLTVRQAITKWSPPVENDTERYIKFVCDKTGAKEDQLVSDLLKDVEI